jgi:S1-C subfamily serine protease
VAHSQVNTAAAFAILFAIVGVSFMYVSANSGNVSVTQTSSRPWIGIEGAILTPAIAKAAGTSEQSGFLVTRVLPGSPAEKAGIRGGDRIVSVGNEQLIVGGDVIVEVDGKPITTGEQIRADFQNKHVGDTMQFTIARGSVRSHISAVLEEDPRPR